MKPRRGFLFHFYVKDLLNAIVWEQVLTSQGAEGENKRSFIHVGDAQMKETEHTTTEVEHFHP